ncbi:MAG: ribonuclease P protein component [Planctomycetota bacterium]|nr:ribonuclease P protein component [Planctomycetota bacterium]
MAGAVMQDSGPGRPLHFRRRHRLSRSRDYQAVYRSGKRRARGPVVLYAAPNDCGHPRLGLSIGRRCGNAVTRNRIKRRLREAFRHLMPRLPSGYDLVVNVRPHEPLELEDYTRLLEDCWRGLHQAWARGRKEP